MALGPARRAVVEGPGRAYTVDELRAMSRGGLRVRTGIRAPALLPDVAELERYNREGCKHPVERWRAVDMLFEGDEANAGTVVYKQQTICTACDAILPLRDVWRLAMLGDRP